MFQLYSYVVPSEVEESLIYPEGDASACPDVRKHIPPNIRLRDVSRHGGQAVPSLDMTKKVCGFIILILFRFCGLFRRSYRSQNIWLIAKIFCRDLLDVVDRDGVHIALEGFVVIEAEPVNFIQGALVTE
jgi:hypothetical protein